MEAFGLPKGSDEEKAARTQAIQDATKYAIEIPFKVMETAFKSMEVMEAMAKEGLQASISDAGVGALCARTAVQGAYLNVKINVSGLKDKDFVDEILAKAKEVDQKAALLENEILAIVDEQL